VIIYRLPFCPNLILYLTNYYIITISDKFMQDGGFSITALSLKHVHDFNV